MADNLFWRNAGGRLTFSMGKSPADSYRVICKAVVDEFKLDRHSDLVTDFQAIVFQNYHRGNEIVGLEWDNWMGYMVVAQTAESESLVQDIGDWLLQSNWATQGEP